MIIKFNTKQSNTDDDDNYVNVPLNIFIDKDYYKRIMKVCEQKNITFGELLNDALGDYMSFFVE